MKGGTEELIEKVSSVTNEFNSEGELVKPAYRVLTMQERVDREDELVQIDEFLNQPQSIMRTLHPTPERLNNLRSRRKRVKKELENSSPPTDLTGEQKDALYKLEKEKAEEIQEGMLPWEDMTRNPVGAVDHNLRWQRAKKAAILTWKNIRRMLNPDSEDKDLANMELLRPRRYMQGNGTSITMMDSEAPGHISYSHIPDEKWQAAGLPLINPNSPIGQMEKREEEERLAQLERENVELRAALEAESKKQEGIRQKRMAAMAKARSARKSKKPEAAGPDL